MTNPVHAYVAANAVVAAAATQPDVFYGTSFIITEIAVAVRSSVEKTRAVMAAHDANDLARLKAAHDDLCKVVGQAAMLNESLARVIAFHVSKLELNKPIPGEPA